MQLTNILRHAAPSLAVLALASSAQGASSPPLHTLDIEVVDSSKTASETTRFVLALDGQKPAKLSVPVGDLAYSLDARIEAPSSAIALSVHRWDKRPGSPARVDLDLSVSPQPGARTVVASALRPDGSKIELAIRLH